MGALKVKGDAVDSDGSAGGSGPEITNHHKGLPDGVGPKKRSTGRIHAGSGPISCQVIVIPGDSGNLVAGIVCDKDGGAGGFGP